jgi:hypothetical protein
MIEKNDFKKDYEESGLKTLNELQCNCGDSTPNKNGVCDTCKFLDEKQKESLLIHLFGDTPKSRILDFLIANKGRFFSKTEISRGANVFKTAFFKQNQSKHYYDYFGDLLRLGVVIPVDNGGRYAKYAIDVKVLKGKLKEIVG